MFRFDDVLLVPLHPLDLDPADDALVRNLWTVIRYLCGVEPGKRASDLLWAETDEYRLQRPEVMLGLAIDRLKELDLIDSRFVRLSIHTIL